MFIPEISWYIYGNTIVYNSNFLLECADHKLVSDMWNFDTGTLRKMMLALIFYGYLYMLIALVIMIMVPVLICALKSQTDDQIMDEVNDDRNDYVDNIPGGELIINYRTNKRAKIQMMSSQSYVEGTFNKRETQNDDMISLLTSRVASSQVLLSPKQSNNIPDLLAKPSLHSNNKQILGTSCS